MIKQRTLTLAAVAALSLLSTDAALARRHAPAAKPAPAAEQPAQPTGKLVEYADLERQVGSEIVIETTLHTVRRGKLIKYTNPAITIQMGPENGSMELTVPRETVRNVSLVLAPPPAPEPAAEPAAAAKPTGTGSAEKN